MAEIINIAHETATPSSEYTSIVTTGGDLTFDSAGSLAYTNTGMSVVVDDGTADYGRKLITASTTKKWRFRFYLDINTISMGNADLFDVLELEGPTPNFYTIAWVIIRRTGSVYQIDLGMKNDGGTATYLASAFTITDAPHYIEVYIQGATGAGANDGSGQIWVDGVNAGSQTTIDNDVRGASLAGIYMGATIHTFSATGLNGTVYLDQLVGNDTGDEIGPYYNPAVGAVLYGYNVPATKESAIAWPEWDDGAAGAVAVSGDANWGKLELEDGEEGRGNVIDLGDANPKTFTITENAYGSGQGDADLEIRGDTNPFAQDDVSPAWDTYAGPVLESWRYVQIRESRE